LEVDKVTATISRLTFFGPPCMCAEALADVTYRITDSNLSAAATAS